MKKKTAPQSSLSLLIIGVGVVLFVAAAVGKMRLPLMGPLAPVSEATTSLEQVTSQVWAWKQTTLSDGTIVKPAEGKPAFTITFTDEDRVLVATDCNTGSGGYTATVEDSLLTFAPLAMTRKFCTASQENTFTTQLSEVESFSYQPGVLHLNLKEMNGQMEFVPAAN
jgi:heat shock protein HslJ